ncbi:TnsD family transposase [Pseudoalteromonas shioyasakiensis]|uniref:TnsD family transposase n=1 Tax=Pseudoalteromonas shioyasakiensis TaxID=1190813 RepID=A0ABT6U1H6_9GAMM|nr:MULTISPECIES: hypothetical protein [Pseudoalteromonas]MDI4669394.1 TnsD family transposase [Pseudoalteromonas shioyasakiensis]MDI4673413.1 TnsD family transposase [Pseudoalteromonas shioyasakiensis]MDI4685910.1 TnsD family transposase [Pseudoalteromonas shioyasakiensis]MDI4704200.1 TnsD family transposase [Pseudoalteromonas shioyasakiensis]NUJ23507.1 hypothetical protein [Pseudoalteromonas sp. 0802]
MSSVVRKPQINAYPFEGEHVISLMVRHHLYSGIRDYGNAMSCLTDDYKQPVPYDFSRPLYRDIYEAFAPSMNYETFLGKYTPYYYYAPFLPASLSNQSSDKRQSAKNINRVKCATQWRHCGECVKDDIKNIGEAYYHVAHQIPGMSHCVKHGTPLFVPCNCCYRDLRLLHWIGLPHESHCPKCHTTYNNLDGYMDDDIEWILRTSLRFLNNEFPGLNLSILQQAYRDYIGVDEIEKYSSMIDKKRLTKAQRELDNYFAPALYERLFDRTSFNGNRKFVELWISQMTYSEKITVPICHLLMIRMLFGEIENIPNLMS